MSNNSKEQGITAITVSGFKSLRDESRIEVRPLTILAGANSSGKSSIMQPLLLMKQTLEAPYDPGALKLDGPNVQFTRSDQFFSFTPQNGDRIQGEDFSIAVELDAVETLFNMYGRSKGTDQIQVLKTEYRVDNQTRIWLRADMSREELARQIPEDVDAVRMALVNIAKEDTVFWYPSQYRCFLYTSLQYGSGEPAMTGDYIPFYFFPVRRFSNEIGSLIHVPGLRGNPERTYPTTPVTGPRFEGRFESYTASVIKHFSAPEDRRSSELVRYLYNLGLASGMNIIYLDDTRIAIRIGSSLDSPQHDVSIADVGFGVSQVLPVLVALLVAEPGQLVYLEQPELHLHPRAQVALAQVLADAANRGVRVVAETHSSLLLLGIQTLIAEGKLAPEKAILHWFTRDNDGATTIRSQQPDENGAYGDWPEDFADVQLDADSNYLDAVSLRQME